MTLYCRNSLYDNLEIIANFLFEITNKSLEFLENFIGIKYPFSKFD